MPVYPDRGWVGPLVLPFTGWPRWLWALGHYQAPTIPDAPGRGGAVLVAGCLLLIGAGLVVALLRRSLPARCGLVFGGYASLLGRVLPTPVLLHPAVAGPVLLRRPAGRGQRADGPSPPGGAASAGGRPRFGRMRALVPRADPRPTGAERLGCR